MVAIRPVLKARVVAAASGQDVSLTGATRAGRNNAEHNFTKPVKELNATDYDAAYTLYLDICAALQRATELCNINPGNNKEQPVIDMTKNMTVGVDINYGAPSVPGCDATTTDINVNATASGLHASHEKNVFVAHYPQNI